MAKLVDIDDHLDPTSEITLEAVKERAVKGVAVLTGRTFILRAISFAAFGFLGSLLLEEDLGVFFIVSALVNFLNFFSDVGLAAALIQKKEKISKRDLNTTFFVQQLLVLSLLGLLYLLAPILEATYSLSYEGRLLMYALGIAFLMASLKTIPSVLLERELEFSKFVLPEILENVVYNLVVVYFAWKGLGVRSFTYAVLVRGVVGLVAIYILRPWFPSFELSKKSLKKLLTFGIPFQLNRFLALIKDDGMTLVLGGIIGTGGVGILGWAQKWAQTPLRLFMDNVMKVTFPAFSRMQEQKDHLAQSVTRSIFFVCFLVFPSVVGLLVLAPLLIKIIPRYERWEPALLPLGFLSINTIFAASTTQLTNLLNAIGKIKTTFKLMVMWTVLTWLFIPFLAIRFGVNGAAAGYALVGSSSVIAVYVVYKKIQFSLYKSVFTPAIASLGMGVILIIVRGILPIRMFSVWFLGGLGVVSYIPIMYLLAGSAIINDAKRGIKAVISRS